MKNIFKFLALLISFTYLVSLFSISTAKSMTKSYAYVSTLFGSKVFVIDLSSNVIIDTINIFTPTGIDYLVSDLRIFKDKAFLTVPGDMFNLTNQVKVIDTDLESVIDSISTNNAPSGITVYDDKIYVLNRFSKSIHEIDPINNSIIRTITFTTSYPNSPIFLEITDGKIYLPCPGSGGTAGGVEVLDLLTGAKIKSISFQSIDNYGPIGIKKVGLNKIYVGGHQDIGVIDITTDSLVKTFHAKDETAGYIFAFTIVGDKVYTANSEGTSSVINLSTNTLMKEIMVGYCFSCSYFNVDITSLNNKVYMTIPNFGVKIIDATTDQLVDSIATPDYVGALDILYKKSINILSISDVPNDQGKQVQIVWTKCEGESDDINPIRQYGVWRMDDSPVSKSILTKDSFNNLGYSFTDIKNGDRINIGGEVWTFVGWSPISGLEKYSLVVPTLFDSTITAGMYWTKFMVSGHSADFALQVWSNVDSGYSIDNLVPHAPLAFQASVNLTTTPTIHLTWQTPPDPDVNYYAIYRSTNPNFDFENTPPIVTTTETLYDDSDLGNESFFYYVLRAFDFSGNKGATTSLIVEWMGVKDMNQIPSEFALSQNYPNPFNPITSIRYQVPFNSFISLKLFNTFGQELRTLVNEEKKGGYYEVILDASQLPSGVYYYNLIAQDKSTGRIVSDLTQKAILLK